MWNKIIFFLTGILGFGFLPSTWGEVKSATAASELPVFLEILQGSYVYDPEKEIIDIRSANGEPATLLLGDRSITADTIRYEKPNHQLHASGHVRLWNEGLILKGEHLLISLDQQEGVLEQVERAEISENVYFTGDALVYRQRPAEIPKEATQPTTITEYTLYRGTVTTCELPYPHYTLNYDKLVMIPNQRMWVFDTSFMAGSWPLFYLPFFSQSLRTHEVAYIFYAAHYSRLGTGLFNRLRIATSDKYSVDLYGDYYTKAGIGKGGKIKFNIPGEYGPKGEIYGYHIRQEAPDNDAIYDGKDRYHLYAEYSQDLPGDMRLIGRGHRFSDSEFRWDYHGPERIKEFEPDYLERDTLSFVSLSKLWDDQSLRITAASRLDPFYYNGLPYVEREPQIHFEQYPMRLFDSELSAALQMDFGRYRREQGVTYPLDYFHLYDKTEFIDEFDRYDAELVFSYPIYLPGRLTLKPWTGFRATYYDDPSRRVNDPNVLGLRWDTFESTERLMLEGGMDLSTRMTYEFDPFLERYDKMRVVLEPVLSYGYFHPNRDLEEFGLAQGIRFPYIDPVDEIRYEMQRFSALLRTRIQGKKDGGGTSDFIRFTAGMSYDQFPEDNLRYDDFEFFDDLALHGDHRYSDLVEDFAIFPWEWISLGNTLRYDIDDSRIRSSFYYTNLTPLERLHLNLGYYTYLYPFPYPIQAGIQPNKEQEEATLQLLFDVSKKWQVFWSSRYDIDEEQLRRNYIGIMRDMHDFYAVFSIEYQSHPTLGDEVSFQIGFQTWGIGGRRGQNQPVRY